MPLCLGRYASDRDRTAALQMLSSDANGTNRVIAAAVLTNFPEYDDTWHALVAALRDSDDNVATSARTALRVLRESGSRPVDWRPALEDLTALLAGANAWAFADLLSTLDATEIDPGLAGPLLAGNWHLLMAHARARFPGARDPAAALLSRLSGLPDSDVPHWESWAMSLPAPTPDHVP